MTTEVTVEAVNAMVTAQFTGTPNRCAELGAGYAVARYDVDQTALRPGGFISGPAQFGLADAALWYLVFAAIGRIEPMALTSELSIRYLRPAQGSVLWARATLESAGRRNVVGTVHMWCDDRVDKPTADGAGHVRPAVAGHLALTVTSRCARGTSPVPYLNVIDRRGPLT